MARTATIPSLPSPFCGMRCRVVAVACTVSTDISDTYIASIFKAETVKVTTVPTANIASLFLCEARIFSCEHSGSKFTGKVGKWLPISWCHTNNSSFHTSNLALLTTSRIDCFNGNLEFLHCDYTSTSPDAIFIRSHRTLSLRYTSPTADYVQEIVYRRRELLFGTQYDGRKFKGTEKRLVKKVTVVRLLNKTSFYGGTQNATLFLFTNCTTYRNNDHLQGKTSFIRKFIVQTCKGKLSRIVRYNVHTKLLDLQIHFKDQDAK